jgi:hypothetical protein
VPGSLGQELIDGGHAEQVFVPAPCCCPAAIGARLPARKTVTEPCQSRLMHVTVMVLVSYVTVGSLAEPWVMCSTVVVLVTWLVAAAFFGLVVASLIWRTWVFPAVVVVLAVLWIFVDKPVEGPVIWDLPAEIGGVTVGDLLVLPALAVGVGLLRRALKQRGGRGPASEAVRSG